MKDNNLINKLTNREIERERKINLLIEYKKKHGDFNNIQDKEIRQIVYNFRAAYNGQGSLKLTPNMIKKLNQIGFPWECNRGQWFKPFCEKLIAYKEERGNFRGVTRDKEIGHTVQNVRRAYRGLSTIRLTSEMINKLNDIGFPWESGLNNTEGKWFSPFYERLIEYKEQNGNFYGITHDEKIGDLVTSVRCSYRGVRGRKLTPEMIEMLNEINFPWEAEFGMWFDPFYEKLVAYKEKNGSFYGITQDKEIGQTAQNVRRAYKGQGTYKITQEMIKKLNDIGFPWKTDFNDVVMKNFQSFYERLVVYKEEKGNFSGVTQDKEIGNYVKNIRKAYKFKEINKLTPDMIKKLNDIGFPWENEYGGWFEPFYKKLIEYKNSHNGTFHGVTQDKEIGLKVSSIRKAYKGKGEYRLTQEMIDKLNEIGFTWEAKTKKSADGVDGNLTI